MRFWYLFLTLALGATLPLACSEDDDAAPPASPSTPLALSQCKYTITPRAEYTELFAPGNATEASQGATSPQPNFRRIRLGLGGNVRPGAEHLPDPSTSVAIAWETDEAVSASWVQYGTSADPATWKPEDRAYGVAYTVPLSSKTPGGRIQRLHEVHLCGLSPSTTYHYRVGGGPPGQEVWSEPRSFRTTPPAGAEEEITVAVTGDSRGNHNSAWQILQERLYKRGDVNLQLFSGDMVDLAFDQDAYETWLDNAATDTSGQPSMLGQVLTLIAMGNHELYNPQFFSTVVQPQDPSYDRLYDELFFSTNVGPLHAIILDDERVAKPGSDTAYAGLLADWLKEDLKAVDRSKTPWVVVVHHRSEFSSSNHGTDADVLRVREALMPIWDEFKVDLILAGHDHNYERSKPLHDAKNPTPGQGTRYVVCAGSGAESYGNGKSDFTEVSHTYDDKSTIGVYGILKASRTRLSFTAHHLTTDGTDPEIDKFELP